MEQQNNLQRNVGVIISVVVILGVVLVSIIMGRKSSDTATTTADQVSSVTVPVAVPDSVTPQVRPSNRFSDDDAAASDESGSGTASIPITNPPATINTPQAITTKKTAYAYKNGTYSATGSYMSPGGQDQIAVTVTIANDIITDASVAVKSADYTSQKYIGKFLSGYKQYVIGKDISSLNLTRVSGSSLTPIGFDNALSQIKAQAKS